MEVRAGEFRAGEEVRMAKTLASLDFELGNRCL